MILGMHHVSLEVRNLQEMIDFYSAFGFKPTKSAIIEERQTRLDMLCHQTGPCLEFSSVLTPAKSRLAEEQVAAGNAHMAGHIALEVNDLDREVSNIQERGMSFETLPKQGKFGRFAFLRDPEGNLLELIEPY